MVGTKINQEQLSHIAERSMLESDLSKDREIDFEEFQKVSFVYYYLYMLYVNFSSAFLDKKKDKLKFILIRFESCYITSV